MYTCIGDGNRGARGARAALREGGHWQGALSLHALSNSSFTSYSFSRFIATVAQNLPSFVDKLMRSMHARIAYLLLDSTYFY